MFGTARDVWMHLKWLYFQYTIHLGVIVMEPWERNLFNSTLMIILATTMYTTYIFLPGHLLMWVRVFKSVASYFLDIYSNEESLQTFDSTGRFPSE